MMGTLRKVVSSLRSSEANEAIHRLLADCVTAFAMTLCFLNYRSRLNDFLFDESLMSYLYLS
jgi:hypothetical protein